ncbi:MAG TPA: ABC transporter permease [Thermoleophilaceae bacterium]|nr:ABC transporter permease [Thermoleophilaceae bacterium]
MNAFVLADSGPVIPNFGRGSNCVRDNHTFCWGWVKQHWSDTLGPALVQHIELTLIALGIGFAISLACAFVAHRHGWFERPFATFSGILYTIPSLALFQLLVPISGFSGLTVQIALVSYTLLILFRNTLTGLRSVPEDTREAARGMGLSARQMLWKVELPLAVPAIIAGLRVATVTVISLATIGSLITDQGLGSPIFHALNSDFNTELIAAGTLAVLLAITADGLLLLTQRLITPWTRTRRT